MPDVSPSVAACMSDMASEILSLRARLAQVEAERDEAKLAAVEALCATVPVNVVFSGWEAGHAAALAMVRAALTGDDRG